MSGPHRTPQVDIYTALLAIALVAVILATLFAYLETSDYADNKYKGAPNVPTVVQVDRSRGWLAASEAVPQATENWVFASLQTQPPDAAGAPGAADLTAWQ